MTTMILTVADALRISKRRAQLAVTVAAPTPPVMGDWLAFVAAVTGASDPVTLRAEVAKLVLRLDAAGRPETR